MIVLLRLITQEVDFIKTEFRNILFPASAFSGKVALSPVDD